MSKHIRNSLYITMTLLALMLLSCIPQSPPGNIVDGLGRKIMINAVPQRIVSLAPSNTEILFALGLGDKVVGVLNTVTILKQLRLNLKWVVSVPST